MTKKDPKLRHLQEAEFKEDEKDSIYSQELVISKILI